jgi:hypothetical protein
MYQPLGEKRVEVTGQYELLEHGQGALKLPKYDARQPLVIDPTVSFTRFLAGSDQDEATSLVSIVPETLTLRVQHEAGLLSNCKKISVANKPFLA